MHVNFPHVNSKEDTHAGEFGCKKRMNEFGCKKRILADKTGIKILADS